jgi:hypothetical protein
MPSVTRQTVCASYALGHPLPNVRDLLRQSIEAHERVFELRGTDPAFPVTVATIDPSLAPTDPYHVRVESAHPPQAKDYSLGNSQRAYHVACLALAAAQPDAARRIALMAWDPPKADYIGYGKYSVCTLNEQRLAYAMRGFFEHDRSGALKLVNMIGPTRGERRDVVDQATMWKGLLREDESLYKMLQHIAKRCKLPPPIRSP